MKYYFDSNIFIYSVTEEVVGGKARKALEKVEKGGLEGCTSALTLDEVVWIVQNETERQTAIETGERLLEMENMEIIQTDTETGRKSLEIMSKEPEIDPRDAIHAATAEINGAKIVTEDSDIREAESIETLDTDTLLERTET